MRTKQIKQAGERTQQAEVRHIDMTPTWEGIWPILAETSHHPDSRAELTRMAKLADQINTPLHKAASDLLEACEEIIEGMIDGPNRTQKNVTAYAIGKVVAAITKAKGTAD